jgi:hypothetical protein
MSSRNLAASNRRVGLGLAAIALALHPAIAQRNRPATEPPRAAPIHSTAFAGMKWRHIGPEGNRVSSVAGVDRDRSTYYAGAASGAAGKPRTVDSTGSPSSTTSRSLDRLGHRRAVGPQHRLGRDRRAVHPQQRLTRLGGLAVDRCRHAWTKRCSGSATSRT